MSGFASGSARPSFHQVFFVHLGSPKISVLDAWNEGRGKRGTLTLVKEASNLRPGRYPLRADAYRPSHKADEDLQF